MTTSPTVLCAGKNGAKFDVEIVGVPSGPVAGGDGILAGNGTMSINVHYTTTDVGCSNGSRASPSPFEICASSIAIPSWRKFDREGDLPTRLGDKPVALASIIVVDGRIRVLDCTAGISVFCSLLSSSTCISRRFLFGADGAANRDRRTTPTTACRVTITNTPMYMVHGKHVKKEIKISTRKAHHILLHALAHTQAINNARLGIGTETIQGLQIELIDAVC